MATIYKICSEGQWRDAEAAGQFKGSEIDLSDGFIHFSSVAQVGETAARHFGGRAGLLLVAVDGDALGDALQWEVSRGGALFPHLYGPLPLSSVEWVEPLPLGEDGHHVFPPLAL